MICKECGTKLYRSDADEDGRLVCPSCGKRYRLKSKPADGVADTKSASAKSGTATRKTAAKAKTSKRSKKRKNGGGKIILIVSVLALIAAAVVIAFVVKGGTDGGKTDSSYTADKTTSSSASPAAVANPYEVGKVITFGAYEQDNNILDGNEPIEWIIAKIEKDGTLVLISKYALDCKEYNVQRKNVTWETCTLRTWLNDSFYNTAFSSTEKARILITKVENGNEELSHVKKAGNDTEDKVYLPSLYEVYNFIGTSSASEKVYPYFSGLTNDRRKCAPTQYAKNHGVSENGQYYGTRTEDGEYTCYWWLRTPGNSLDEALSVIHTGAINDSSPVSQNNYGVRPVIRIKPENV